jgi:hypothetical protein
MQPISGNPSFKFEWDHLYPNPYEIRTQRYTRFTFESAHYWPNSTDPVFLLVDRHDTITRDVVPFAIRVPAKYDHHYSELIMHVQAARIGWRQAYHHNGDPRWMHILYALGVLLRYLDRVLHLVHDELKMVLGNDFSAPLHPQYQDFYNFHDVRLPTLEEFTVKNGRCVHEIPNASLPSHVIEELRSEAIPEPYKGGKNYPAAVPGCRHWVTRMYTDAIPRIAPEDTLDSQCLGLGGSQWKKETRVPSTWPPTYPDFCLGELVGEFMIRNPLVPGDSNLEYFRTVLKEHPFRKAP